MFVINEIAPACGPGWFKIIDAAIEELEFMNWSHCEVTITDIKEKFGTLNIYFQTDGSSEEFEAIYSVIQEAERLSAKTCETCGQAGTLRKIGGWYSTLCDNCEESRRNILKNKYAELRGDSNG